ncbi:hypothetical protein [Leptospira alstonii]|uniref:hypothetical protein n=1 Tax=Leptospira alstonii TaxID=28452 RepID=UPI001E3C62E4|nr:hypothetical protein [Leptospira alstonii]
MNHVLSILKIHSKLKVEPGQSRNTFNLVCIGYHSFFLNFSLSRITIGSNGMIFQKSIPQSPILISERYINTRVSLLKGTESKKSNFRKHPLIERVNRIQFDTKRKSERESIFLYWDIDPIGSFRLHCKFVEELYFPKQTSENRTKLGGDIRTSFE